MLIQPDSKTQVELLTASRQRQNITIANDYLQNIYRQLALVTVLIPFIGSVVAIGLLSLSGTAIGSVEVGLLISMYALTIFGVEVGFHRHFSHHAFQTTTAVRVILALLGSMAAQGGVIYWVANHRRHHQYNASVMNTMVFICHLSPISTSCQRYVGFAIILTICGRLTAKCA